MLISSVYMHNNIVALPFFLHSLEHITFCDFKSV